MTINWTYSLYGTPFENWVGGAVNWSGASDEYIMGGLLDNIQRELPGLSIEFAICKRDVSPSMGEIIEVVNAAELLEIYRNPDNPKAKGEKAYEVAKTSVQGLMWHEHRYAGYSQHVGIAEKTTKRLQVKIGPSEVSLADLYVRKAHKIPEEKLAFFREAGFPEKLDPTASIATAFDKDSGILAIIAPRGSALLKLAEFLE